MAPCRVKHLGALLLAVDARLADAVGPRRVADALGETDVANANLARSLKFPGDLLSAGDRGDHPVPRDPRARSHRPRQVRLLAVVHVSRNPETRRVG